MTEKEIKKLSFNHKIDYYLVMLKKSKKEKEVI